jgi:thiol-disulfide isomerase/thioredoxin
MTMRTRCWSWARLSGTATLLAWGTTISAAPPPTPAQVLSFSPRQPGVDITTPTAEQISSCKVSKIQGKRGIGWLLSDAAGNPLRRFYDANEDGRVDIWSYYKDGVEVYREVDSNFNGKADQYRWLHTAGSKWGVDVNEDGRIDSWKMISPEEVSQEILLAVSTKDYARLQALLLTEAEIKALELSPAEAQRLRESLKQVQAKFDELVTKMKGIRKANWQHLETGIPQCRPGDAVGSHYDLVRHIRGTLLYEANGKSDWLQTGEMVKVGEVWRLVEGPSFGAASVVETQTPASGTPVSSNPKVQKKIEELSDLDKNPPTSTAPGPNPDVVKYNLKRADVLEAIIAEVPATERISWIKQMADSLSTAIQNSGKDEKVASQRMALLEKQIVEAMKGSNLAAYVSYHFMQADYNKRLLESENGFAKVQQDWIDSLTRFVAAYPKAEDTPDAMLELGKTCEFLAKEADAKKAYTQLAHDFGDKPQAIKARGAVRRLELDAKPLELSGATLDGSSFDMSKVRGKVVVVYYWASWNQKAVEDFAKLKQLVETYGSKGFELVSVNLDGTAEEMQTYLKRVSPPGTQIHQDGGLESTLATDYGIMVLPNLFLAGKDGKVVSRNVQLANLEDEIKKLLK